MRSPNPEKVNVVSEEVLSFVGTLGNADWIRSKENLLKEIFPENWVDARHVDLIRLARDLRTAGVPWKNIQQVPKIFAFLEKIGIIERIGDNFRRNPRPLFRQVH